MATCSLEPATAVWRESASGRPRRHLVPTKALQLAVVVQAMLVFLFCWHCRFDLILLLLLPLLLLLLLLLLLGSGGVFLERLGLR